MEDGTRTLELSVSEEATNQRIDDGHGTPTKTRFRNSKMESKINGGGRETEGRGG